MSDLSTFNLATGLEAERKLMVCYVNTATSASPVWEALGYGVEDSAIEFNFEVETKTDILGQTRTRAGKPQRQQSFEPCEIRDGSALQVKLYNIMRNERWAELAAFECLIVHKYAGTADTAMEAEKFGACAIVPASLGGSLTLGMPFDVHYGGTHTLGTAAISSAGVVTFTADT